MFLSLHLTLIRFHLLTYAPLTACLTACLTAWDMDALCCFLSSRLLLLFFLSLSLFAYSFCLLCRSLCCIRGNGVRSAREEGGKGQKPATISSPRFPIPSSSLCLCLPPALLLLSLSLSHSPCGSMESGGGGGGSGRSSSSSSSSHRSQRSISCCLMAMERGRETKRKRMERERNGIWRWSVCVMRRQQS